MQNNQTTRMYRPVHLTALSKICTNYSTDLECDEPITPKVHFCTSRTARMRFSWTGGTARSVSLAVVAVVGTARGWTVAQTVAGVCLWAVCACVAMRVAAGRPRSLLGNTLSRRHKGRRFKLYAMPINHYGEKVWSRHAEPRIGLCQYPVTLCPVWLIDIRQGGAWT